MVDIYIALLSKALYSDCGLTFTHSCTHSHTDSRFNHAVRVRRLAQGHLHTQTSNLAVTSKPTLPPGLVPPFG